MFSMISSVMNVRELDVIRSLLHSFVPTSHVCSITVSSAGPPSTQERAENTTNR